MSRQGWWLVRLGRSGVLVRLTRRGRATRVGCHMRCGRWGDCLWSRCQHGHSGARPGRPLRVRHPRPPEGHHPQAL